MTKTKEEIVAEIIDEIGPGLDHLNEVARRLVDDGLAQSMSEGRRLCIMGQPEEDEE